MNLFKHFLSVALVVSICTGIAVAEIEIGSTRAEVIAEWGEPTGTLRDSKSEELVFRQATLTLEAGRVTKVLKLSTPSASSTKPPAPSKRAVVRIEEDKRTGDIRVIGGDGQRIALADLLVRDKITVVDFYADWCGPCRQLTPVLETMAGEDAAIALRKVNIVNWNTPIARQYGLNSIPNVRVFDRQGKQVGEAVSRRADIIQNIEAAKKR